MKRRISLCLAVLCLLNCVGCAGGEPVSSAPTPSVSVEDDRGDTLQYMALAYSRDDTLNPYAAATKANLRLAPLLYDSLTVMQEDFTPRLSLAASLESPDATHVAVTLREGAVFSDGSPVTAEDVLASWRQAKTGKNHTVLTDNIIAAAEEKQTGRLLFTLAAPDPQAAACLSFPVIKASTLTTAVAAAPLGGGQYTLQSGTNGQFLQANPHFPQQAHFQTVSLRHLPNTDSLHYGLASGDITYYYNDLSGNQIPRVSGAHTAVDMSTLFYMGVNSQRSALAKPAVRQALSLLLDRPALATAACAGWAEGSELPLHPRFGPVAALQLPAGSRDLSGAVQKLGEAGFGTGNGQTVLKPELIYHADNAVRAAAAEQIRLQAQGAGVEITLVPLSEQEFFARLKGGQYDLYLGEIRLAANMSLLPLLGGGSASYGISAASPASLAYRRYLNGEDTLQAFLQVFGQEMPFIPLGWRRGFVAYDRRLRTATPTAFDAYAGMGLWK